MSEPNTTPAMQPVPEPRTVEELDQEAAALVRAWSHVTGGSRAARGAALDRLASGFDSMDCAGAVYVTAILCHELPARDREILMGELRARVMP